MNCLAKLNCGPEVTFDSSQLEGKSNKAVLLIANHIDEKVKAAKKKMASVKYVDFVYR